MDPSERIAQFEQLVQEDPGSDMGWFSLGGAYAEAGRHADAATAFERTIAINMNLSRAYQLAAEQYLAIDEVDKAKPLLEQGHEVASRNGDLKVKDAIAAHFEAIGLEAPREEVVDLSDLPEGTFVCRRTRRPGTQMERPPFRGPIGAWIQANIAAETWNDWIGQGTKVINELRLDLSRDEDAATYDRYMHEYLGITDEVLAEVHAESSS